MLLSLATAFSLSCRHRGHPTATGVVHPSGHSQHGRGAQRAIRGLKGGRHRLRLVLVVHVSGALEFGWLRLYFCEFLQTVRCAAYSVGGGDSHWRTRWKISSTAPRCTSSLSLAPEASRMRRHKSTTFHRVTVQTLPMRCST